MTEQSGKNIGSLRGHRLAVISTVGAAVIFVYSGTTHGRQPDPTPTTNPKQRLRQSLAASELEVDVTAHRRGNLQLVIANNGTFGGTSYEFRDELSWDVIQPCEYPRRSEISYLGTGALWIGAVVGRDTLVSCGGFSPYGTDELWPDFPELGGRFTFASIDRNSDYYNPATKAYSEEDIICEYYDTLTNLDLTGWDWYDHRGHQPLGVKVTQRSMAWSFDYADDFIIFDYIIENMGSRRLNKLYVGIHVDGDVTHQFNPYDGWADDIAGFLREYPAPEGCGFIDTLNVAYIADNDGDPLPTDVPEYFDFRSPKAVVGIRLLGTPSDTLRFSYNWWARAYGAPRIDFGPRRAGTAEDPFRMFHDGLGVPTGDRNKYYMMSHNEHDYDQLWTAFWQTTDGWLPPPANAEDIADGLDCRYLLSFGPFDLNPGQSLPFTFAWVAGDQFHKDPADFSSTWDPRRPWNFYSRLDFSDLAKNARWASWVYDNPGEDTDGDGYAGKARICDDGYPGGPAAGDTFWYEGDGVPDFRGAGPPPAPAMRVFPSLGSLTIRFNGFYSETTEDVFSHRPDFEGYRIYAGRDDLPSNFSLFHSYDIEDYKVFIWRETEDGGYWRQYDRPYSLEELRQVYGDAGFEPLDHPRTQPMKFEGQFYYFDKQDYNHSEFSLSGLHKVYPDATDPGIDPTLWSPDDLIYDYNEPLPRYYEYEYVLDSLLPTIPYYVAVTAFDYGSPNSDLSALETKPEHNSIGAYPQLSVETPGQELLDVYVYPNPYRIDAHYADRGYENRDRTLAPDRARLIHFANLPKVCKISIFSLDGDLVREIDHNYPEGGHLAMHDSWDLITRNTQAVVSGLYYWIVESKNRTQIGKLVIIK